MENISEKIHRIGEEGETKAKEYLSKNGYIILDNDLIEKELIKTGKKLNTSEIYKQKKPVRELVEEVKKIKNKYRLVLMLKDGEDYDDYAVSQIKVYENLGCVLSDKEKNYLRDNSLQIIGDLKAKRISDNKLCCFEVKSSEKDYWISGKAQFEENCMARKNEIEVFYFLNNHNTDKADIIDIKELWFNLHLNSTDKIKQPINILPKNPLMVLIQV